MTNSKKALLLSLTSIGAGSVGAYFLGPNNNSDQINIEETEYIPPETFVPREVIVPNLNVEILSEISDASIPVQEQVVEAKDISGEPVINRFGYEGRKRKIGLGDAKPKVEVLRDYTLRVGPATGGFLDYVLPENSSSYPTKGLIATNAHVVANTYFDQSNPYNQILPVGENALYKDGITLIKERVENDDLDFDQSNWDERRRKTFIGPYRGGNVENKQKRDDYNYHYQLSFQEKKPKLVYFPYQYLGTDDGKWPSTNFPNNEYSADFAVMEVDFKEEWIAKFMTRNFYHKYDHEVGDHKDKALDFFDRPIAEQYTNRDIYEKDIHVFTVGYPSSGMGYKSTSNYDSVSQEAARFTYAYHQGRIPVEGGDFLLGHSNVSEANIAYGKGILMSGNEKPFGERGYHYIVEDHYKGKIGGSSGSLNVLEGGKVLGLSSRGISSSTGAIRTIAPLRNKEIKGLDGRVLFPAYDLLEGVDGQQNSYRDQIKKYFLKQGKRTSLSRLRGGSV